MRCGLATYPHDGLASLAVWRTDAIVRYFPSQPSQGEIGASVPGAQWSARGRNIKLPSLTPADVVTKPLYGLTAMGSRMAHA
jgi:hypothetical protein